jgi:hypothetical protein
MVNGIPREGTPRDRLASAPVRLDAGTATTLLTITQGARLSGLPIQVIRRWITRGRLPARMLDGPRRSRYRVHLDEQGHNPGHELRSGPFVV